MNFWVSVLLHGSIDALFYFGGVYVGKKAGVQDFIREVLVQRAIRDVKKNPE